MHLNASAVHLNACLGVLAEILANSTSQRHLRGEKIRDKKTQSALSQISESNCCDTYFHYFIIVHNCRHITSKTALILRNIFHCKTIFQIIKTRVHLVTFDFPPTLLVCITCHIAIDYKHRVPNNDNIDVIDHNTVPNYC